MVITDTVHVETLHEPGTWRKLRAIARFLEFAPPPTAPWPTLPLLSSGGWMDFSLLNPFWKDQDRAEVIRRGEGGVDLKNPIAPTLCPSSVSGLSKCGFLGRSPHSLTQGGGWGWGYVSSLSPRAAWPPGDPCCVSICFAHSSAWGPSDFTHERKV